MSQINTNAILDASGGTTATVNGFAPTASNMAGRNRIINGDMRIDQRNAGASVTPSSSTYTLDRWRAFLSVTSKYSVQQSSVTPSGFVNSLLVTSLSSYSISSGDFFGVQQRVEGFNFSDLGWGTADAKTVTLSFWVRSSLTGTFGGSVKNENATRSYPFTYTVSAADTFEYKTITISGDTTGTWNTTAGVGVSLQFGLGVGSTYSGTAGVWAGADYNSATGATSVVGTNGATFYITGVQLEEGSVATPFEHRQYGQELALCQRYAQVFGGTAVYEEVGYGNAVSTTVVNTILALPVQMRTQPSSTQVGTFQVSDGATAFAASNLGVSTLQSGNQQISLGITSSGLTPQRAYRIETANSTASRLILSAEL